MKKITIGVIADTHLPDRSKVLHPGVKSIFEKAKVEQILHAGDISVPRVLQSLAEVAPVLAVRGNRDLFLSPKLPLVRVIELGGKRIGLTHGHGGWASYIRDKSNYLLGQAQDFSYYANKSIGLVPADVDGVVFGHMHTPMQKMRDGKFIFNPGSACCHLQPELAPSIGLIRMEGEALSGEIIFLDK